MSDVTLLRVLTSSTDPTINLILLVFVIIYRVSSLLLLFEMTNALNRKRGNKLFISSMKFIVQRTYKNQREIFFVVVVNGYLGK